MSFGSRLTLVAILVVVFAQVALTYAEPAALASSLAEYLQEQGVADADAVRSHICTFLLERACTKALFLAAPWVIAIGMLLLSATVTIRKRNVAEKPKGQA